ncbi:MAG: 30S ribosome-binding factor RbfA [Myxococcota bacterium]
MSQENKRTHRVGQLIQQELGRLLVDGVNDPRVGFATITEVRASPDLRWARVYVSVYGSDEQRHETLAGLDAAAGYLKRELGRRLSMKYTPTLSFTFDDSLDRADRLDQVLGAISRGETDVPPDAPIEALPVETSRSSLAERRREFEEPAATKKESREKRSGKRRQRRRS